MHYNELIWQISLADTLKSFDVRMDSWKDLVAVLTNEVAAGHMWLFHFKCKLIKTKCNFINSSSVILATS